jgi:dTDP-4-dehydrorhamnose 3,5-epimerase
MRFISTPLRDACLIALEPLADERGFFARTFCEREFAAAGLETRFVQVNNALSCKRGTLRGLHYQLPPSAEVKVVRCLRGALYDVIVDLRPDSPTFRQWFGAKLDEDNRIMMYVPRGFGHGLLTLTDDVETLYLASAFYAAADERGLRHDDPAFAIRWPIEPVEVSSKDRSWPRFDPAFHGIDAFRRMDMCAV